MCEHSFIETGRSYYSCPLSVEYRCTQCGATEHRDEGPGIHILTGLQAFRMRPALYGLTQEQADGMTCADVHARHPDLVSRVECDGGWINIQHPMRPLGATTQALPCVTCNYDRRFPLPGFLHKLTLL